MNMSTLSNSVISIQHTRAQFLSGSSAVQVGSHHSPNKVFFGPASQSNLKLLKSKRPLTVKASGDGGRSGAAGVFVSGFVLGGLVVGALGAIYAPQISKALAGTDRKEIMRKLPKFIYDEEKALEKTRKILTEKIEQLNSAIDTVSAQLRADNSSNGAAVTPDELEASI